MNRLCLSYHQRKSCMKAIRNHLSGHCTFCIQRHSERTLGSDSPRIRPKVQKCIHYGRLCWAGGQGLFMGPCLWLADILSGYRTANNGLWARRCHKHRGPWYIFFTLHFISRPMSCCDGWMWLLLAGATVLNANCFEGHRIHWLLW